MASKLTDYDVESTPFKRDILGELAAACRKHGLKFCFYHSIMDWHHPNYPPRDWEKDRPRDQVDMEKYIAYMKNQLKELLENYDTGVLWFDGEWEAAWTHETRQGPLRLPARAQARHHHQQPRRQGPQGHGGHEQGRQKFARRLRHARAGDPAHRACPASTGNRA